MKVTTLGFDADDTLWENERFFKLTEERFTELLIDFAEPEHLHERLVAAERRNLKIYGFGIKGFTLSMVETAIEVTEERVPAHVIEQILSAGREMHAHPVETLPYVRETLEQLAPDYRMVLITKGDLFDQERKLAASGLGELFDAVEIVSDKMAATYTRIFSETGDDPASAMMIGNSLKSDIVPAIEAGSWGVHIPHELAWDLEHADEPAEAKYFRRLKNVGEVPALLREISQPG